MEKIVLTTVAELKELLRSVLAEEGCSQIQQRNKDDPEPDAPLLDSKQAMEYLHITSAGTLINYKKKGLPFIQIGRQCLFDKQALTNFLKLKTKKI